MDHQFKLAYDSGYTLAEVLNLPLSYVDDFYNSNAYKEIKQRRKHESEKTILLFKLGNEIIKGLNMLNK